MMKIANPKAHAKSPHERWSGSLGFEVEAAAAVKQLHAGHLYRRLEAFINRSGLPSVEVMKSIGLSSRTLQRRKASGRLNFQESNNLDRLVRAFDAAVGLFDGDVEGARKWFTSPQRALGGTTPLAYTSSDVGAREVEAIVGRIEHGIIQ